MSEDEWTSINNQRCDLIYKDRDFGLPNDEREELAKLQGIASDRINQLYPIDFGLLDRAIAILKGES